VSLAGHSEVPLVKCIRVGAKFHVFAGKMA